MQSLCATNSEDESKVIRPSDSLEGNWGRLCIEMKMALTYIVQVAQGSVVKWLAASLLGLVTFVYPKPGAPFALTAMFALVLLDTITGAIAARVAGKRFSSRRFARVAIKLFGYCALIFTVALVCQVVWEDAKPAMVGLATGLCVTTEGASIIENLKRMGIVISPLLLTLLQQIRPATSAIEDMSSKIDEKQ